MFQYKPEAHLTLFFYEILVAASVECASHLALQHSRAATRYREQEISLLRFVSSAHKMATSLPIVDDNYHKARAYCTGTRAHYLLSANTGTIDEVVYI